MALFPVARLCDCGSGEYSEWEYDARGIELCRCCPACRAERLGQFRPEVLTDADYEADEDIEADYGWDDDDLDY